MTKRVRITHKPGQLLKVDKANVTISIKKKDQVEWVPRNLNFTVDFGSNSPFQRTTFNHNHRSSGAARSGAKKKTYKYVLTVGGDSLDPGVVITG